MTNARKPISPESLDRYFTSSAEPDECAGVEAWLTAQPGLGQLEASPSPAARQALARVLSTPAAMSSPPASVIRHNRTSPYKTAWIAAAITACALSLFVWRRSSPDQPIVAVSNTQTHSTTAGQRATFQLPDGSSVVLGVASQLQYDAGFGVSHRNVRLDGEALFTVPHSSAQPFIVQSGGHTTRVLGTTFSVRKYASDEALRVVVAEGRVGVADVIAGTGDMARVEANGSANVTAADVPAALAWSTGRLVFKEASLRDAIPDLERWYGVTISVADSALLDRGITMSLHAETATQAIDLLAEIVRAHITRQDRRITLTNRPR